MLLEGRSLWRPDDPLMPEIMTQWKHSNKRYHLKDYYLELHPVFSKFDHSYFMDHLVPDGPLRYRIERTKSVDSAHLKKLIEELLVEIKRGKTKFKQFTIIKQADFNWRLKSGLIIVRFKKYPFVLKLFIKTPETFIKQSEGFVPQFFFKMGGGINRHLSGFTRIKNLEEIKKKIKESAYWTRRVDLPRKWFWLPKDSQWIELHGKNIGPNSEEATEIPAIYGIIADEIQDSKTLKLRKAKDRETALAFAHFVGNRVDAHVDNFMLEKATGKIVLVDTEHFPTMVGLKEPFEYETYGEWYKKLIAKCIRDTFLRDKKLRRNLQRYPRREVCPV